MEDHNYSVTFYDLFYFYDVFYGDIVSIALRVHGKYADAIIILRACM